ncbi:MAG TPA: isoprenyl transferase [Vicinamibacteria bacterium]|nr:isoprenyl transferase [Vicinamibacteria bacterium]
MSLTDIQKVVSPGSVEDELLHRIDFERLPAHIAIIMDGNGRWAQGRNLPRVEGHRAGIASVREVVETCARMDIGVLTLYAFSLENWKRPKKEVDTLMKLLKRYLGLELSTLQKNNIRFQVIGRTAELPEDVVAALETGMERTHDNTGLLFNIALNYGGRAEIVDACRSLIREALTERSRASGSLVTEGQLTVDEQALSDHMYTAGMPDPDLLIRTSGELRVSNFLLWQIAYAEIWVTDTLWPDFRKRQLFEGIIDYQKRDRRYGGIHVLSPNRSYA